MLSPETYTELRKFVRENGAPPEDEPEEMEGMSPEPKGVVEIDVKSEPMGGKSVCPTCGHPMPQKHHRPETDGDDTTGLGL